jgi:hypothetical protein
MSYNGWTNRNTWLVNVWFGDGFVQEAEDGIDITAEFIQNTVEDYIESVIGEFTGFVADLIDIRGINYDELAAHYCIDCEDVEDSDD